MDQKASALFEGIFSISPEIKAKMSIIDAVDRPLGSLTINSICAKCGISRQTFYNHFSHKYEMAFWYSHFCQSFYLDQIGKKYRCLNGYEGHFQMMKEKKELFIFSASNKTSPQHKTRACRDRIETLTFTLMEYHGTVIDELMHFAIDSFCFLETELIHQWIASNMAKSSKRFAEEIVYVMPQELKKKLDTLPM